MRGTGGPEVRLRPSKGRRGTEEERVGRTPAARTTAVTTVTATAGETGRATAGTKTAEEGAITVAAVEGEEEGSAADMYRLKPRRAAISGSGWVLAAKADNSTSIILEGCQVGHKRCCNSKPKSI